jgi:hypothetical protein
MTRTHGHGTNGQPTTRPGAEWWARRPLRGTPKGSARWFKKHLHRIERRHQKWSNQ